MGYQPHQKVHVTVNGHTLVRIAPADMGSLRCRLGLHDWHQFVLSDDHNFFAIPWYCKRCSEVKEGLVIRPMPMPSVKPPSQKITAQGHSEEELVKLMDERINKAFDKRSLDILRGKRHD